MKYISDTPDTIFADGNRAWATGDFDDSEPAWSPDGNYVASGGHDTTIRVWQVAAGAGQEVATFKMDMSLILSLAWSQDGKRLPVDTSRNGYHLAFWRAGNLDYCAVSDTGWDELRALERLLNTE